MRKLYLLTQEEAGKLMQFSVLKTENKPVTLSEVKPGTYGCLVEMTKASDGVLRFEDCATISVPLGEDKNKFIYKPVYMTRQSRVLRGSVFI